MIPSSMILFLCFWTRPEYLPNGERMPGMRSARRIFRRKELFIPLTFRLCFVGSPQNQDGDCIQSPVDAPEMTRLTSSA